ncbi:MAG: iron ABC transporter permease [Candidatus Rifleibacteriota bacterium]
MAREIVVSLRLPRAIIAVFLGMSLAAAGAVMQMIFGNPLVDPGFLGVSQGAAFGAALAIVCNGLGTWTIQLSAAFFACLGLFISYYLAWKIKYGSWVLRLILSGICVSAIFSSLLGILKYVSDPTSQLAEISFWLLGGLSVSGWKDVWFVAPVCSICLIVLYALRWRLNVLALRDYTAYSLGVSPNIERALLLIFAVLCTACVTAVSGLVAWVGLIMPHLARRIFGADARFALPGSMISGAILVLVCDDLSRVPFSEEIPLGIITSLVGASFFLALMMSNKAGLKR